MAHIGFAEHTLIRSGIGLPIVDLKTAFKGMCRHGDKVSISLALSKVGHSSIGMEYTIQSGEQVKLQASAVVVYSKVPDGKPVRIPDDLRHVLQPYLQPDPSKPI